MTPSTPEDPRRPLRVAGVMTGTSADGIDMVVCELVGAPPSLTIKLLHHESAPLPAGHRERVQALASAPLGGAEWAALEHGLSKAIADGLADLRRRVPFALAGVHGQTIWHRPPPDPAPSTVQVLDPWRVARTVGVPVVFDFRRADVAAGGQGAPLAPWPHVLMFGRRLPDGGAFLNLGGIANLTWIPADGRPEAVRAWDTGPGMMIADALAERLLGRPWDTDGEAAAGGRVLDDWLAVAAADPFFATTPPKSAGRETFGAGFVERWLAHPAAVGARPADLLRTALALTVHGVAQALAGAPGETLIVGGGGARNRTLLADLAAALPARRVAPSDDHGWPAESVEGAAFAILAYERLHDRPGNLPSVTGASARLRLGAIALPD